MKTILFATIAAAATLVPLQAAKVKAQTFVVKSVNIVTVTGKMPPEVPVFKKNSTISLKISPSLLTGPEQISLPIQTKSITADTYFKGTGVLSYTTATVRKDTTTKKPVGVEITFFRPTKVLGNITAPGQVSYVLEPK